MQLIIILILIISLVLMYLIFDYKISLLNRKLLLSHNQYNKLSQNYYKYRKTPSPLEVIFSTPPLKSGITNSSATIFIAPIISSIPLKRLTNKTEVAILDKAQLNFEIWYYVNLPLESNINCRGWIKETDLMLIESSSANIQTISYK